MTPLASQPLVFALLICMLLLFLSLTAWIATEGNRAELMPRRLSGRVLHVTTMVLAFASEVLLLLLAFGL